MEFFAQYTQIFIFLGLLILGYTADSWAERRHYRSIKDRERETLGMQVMTAEPRFQDERVQRAFLVNGSAVISIDYFKRLLAALRNFFGGRVKSYETLLDRARREAILRMQQQAKELGANAVLNIKLETASISKGRKDTIGSVEVLAYGTAMIPG